MADFDVTVDTSIITVTWVSASESGLTGFTIKLETVLKHTGNSGYAADSHQITGLDAGKLYHLLITTNDGTTEREIPTDVTTKPLAVTGLTATATDSSNVTVSWTPGTNSVQDSYQLRYKGTTQATDWTNAVSVNELQKAVTGLFPGDQYTFDVKAVSNSQTSAAETTTEVLYPLPPTGLTVSPTTTTSVKVQWQYDSTKSFCVKWKVKYTVKDMNNFEEVFTTAATDLEKTIDNLTPGKTYTIQVFGVTTNDVVSKTDVHDDLTLKPLAVTGLTASATDSSSVTVNWTPGTNSVQDSYQLRYKGTTQATDWTTAGSVTGQQKAVTGLFPGDQYTFEVKAVSNSQTSAAETTTAVLYPLPPTGLTVSPTTTTSVKVQWQYDSTKSFCVKWKVKYTVKDMSNFQEVFTSGATDLEKTIDNLTPGKTYTIQVFGVTTNDVVSKTDVHNDLTLKPLAVTGLKATATSSSSVTVTWTPGTGSFQDLYKFRFKKIDETAWSSAVDVTDQEKTVSGLFPGDQYTFEVKAVSGSQNSDPRTTAAILYPLPPTRLEVDTQETTTSSVKVKWTYDPTKSHIEKWRVKYTVKDTNNPTYINTASASVLEQVISGLKAGQTYTVSVYGVTTSDIISQNAPEVPATVKPLAVTGLTASATDSSSVTVNWTPGTNSVQDSYQLRYKGTSQAATWTNAVSVNELQKAVTELFPGDQYTFDVKAVSNSQTSAAETTTAVLYPLPPTGLTVSPTTTTSVKVQWQYDSTKSFCVKWKVKYTVKDMNNFQEVFTSVATDLEKTIDNLTPGKTYTIQVFGVTTNGVVSKTDVHDDVTLLPTIARNLTLTSNDVTSLTVTWDVPDSGVWTGYTASVQEENMADQTVSGSGTRTATFTGLTSGKMYTVVVVTESGNQKSAGLRNSFYTIPKDVTGLHRESIGKSYVNLIWTAPGGMWANYSVTYVREGQTSKTTKTAAHDLTQLEIKPLVAGTTYHVTVYTLSGPYSSSGASMDVTTKPSTVVEISLDQRTPTSLDLSWSKTDGTVGEYKLLISPNDGVEQLPVIVPSESTLSHQFSNLKPGHSYVVTITVVSSGKDGEKATRTLTTNPLPPPSLTVSATATTSVTVTWMYDSSKSLTTQWRVNCKTVDGITVNDTTTDSVNPKELTINKLIPGMSYTVSVFGVTNGINSLTKTHVDTTTKPLPVTGLTTADKSSSSVTVRWTTDKVSHQDSYFLRYKSQHKPTDWTSPETVTNQEKTLTGLFPGDQYTFEVKAVSNSKISSAMTTTTLLYPLPPTRLEVDTQETTTSIVKVKWTYDPTKSHIEKWRVKYTAKDTNNPKYINTASASVLEQVISGLKAGQTYTVSVYGVTTSDIISLTAPEVPATVKPLPVTGLNAVVRDSSTVKVTWAPNTDSLQDSYLLRYKSQHKTLVWTSADTLTAQEKTVSGLFPGDQYTFEVKAVSGSQISDPRTTAAILNPLRPVNLTVSETTTTSLKIQWRYDDKKSFCEKWGVNYTETGDYDFISIVTNSVADQETTILSLTPGQSYTIQVFGITTNNIVSQTTELEATVIPNQPSSRCGGEQNAITIYITQGSGWVDSFGIKCNNCTDTLKHQVSKENRFLRYPNLVTDTSYSFTSTAIAGEVFGIYRESTGAEIICLAQESPPYPVRNFHTTYIEPRDLLLSWTEPDIKNGQLKNYTITYSGTKTGKPRDDGEKLTITVDDPRKKKYNTTISNLNAGFTYTFVIRAYNTLEGNASVAIHTMPILPPATIRPLLEAKPRLNDKSTTTQDQFQVDFQNPFSNEYGYVESYSLIVTKKRDDPALNNTVIPYWSTMKKSEDTVFTYVAIEKCAQFFSDGDACWRKKRVRRATKVVVTVTVTVGGDKDCDKDKDVACNGELSPSTTYYVKLRAYADGGKFSDTPLSDGINTESSPVTPVTPVPWGAIGGGLGAAILVIVVIILIVIVMKRQSCFDKKSQPKVNTPMVVIGGSSEQQTRVYISRSCKLADFAERWKEMNANTHLMFATEIEELEPVGREQSTAIAEMPVNNCKNRHSNILPYDRTRIKLTKANDKEGSDYINGNWMPGYNSDREYAVMQGPMKTTRDDFWRMIWEHDAQAIVMLTQCVDNGRDMCDHYWPINTQPLYYGYLKVQVISETKSDHWIMSKFMLTKGRQGRALTHFHYIAWPDCGEPDSPQSLIDFMRLVRSNLGPEEGPIVVHCSAGVAQTGTFVALDRLLQHIEKHDWVDVYSTVCEMRQYRCYMVHHEANYRCIYHCLLNVLKNDNVACTMK